MSQTRPHRSFVMDDPGDLSAEPGSLPWAQAMRLQLLVTFHERDSVANHLQVMRDGFKQHEGWRVLLDQKGRPFPSWEVFCQTPPPFGLGTAPEHLDAEVDRRSKSDAIRQRRYEYPRESQRETARAIGCDQALVSKVMNNKKRSSLRSPLERLRHWWAKASDKDRQAFKSFIA